MLDYLTIPDCAAQLASSSPQLDGKSSLGGLQYAPRATTKLPSSSSASGALGLDIMNLPEKPPLVTSPSSSSLYNNASTLLPQMLLSSTLPSEPGTSTKVPDSSGGTRRNSAELLSMKDPLSIPITTNNFKRFVAFVGPIFWLQDRVEEIITWKKGNKATATWMGIYILLGMYPRLLLVAPLAVGLALLISADPSIHRKSLPPPQRRLTSDSVASSGGSKSSPERASGDEVEDKPKEKEAISFGVYQRNVQAIQNLMGVYSDAYESIAPYSPLITYSPSSSAPYSTLLLLILLAIVPTAILVSHPTFPAQIVALLTVIVPWLGLHPKIQSKMAQANVPHIVEQALRTLTAYLENPQAPYLIRRLAPFLPKQKAFPLTFQGLVAHIRVWLIRVLDDDRLDDKNWVSPLREVELFENERLSPSEADSRSGNGWSKSHLHPVERGPWTRGRDGWSSVGDPQGQVSNLTFSLSPGWFFVDSEDWRKDLKGDWVLGAVDSDGWSYTNDTWSNPQPQPAVGCVTRRRRWVRRVWLDSSKTAS